MFELKARLSSGMLADFSAALRDFRPANYEGNAYGLPDEEFVFIAIRAARKAEWYETAKADITDKDLVEQMREMAISELVEAAGEVMALRQKWMKREVVTVEEKKASSAPPADV
jgi:hypothetical protein